MAAKTFEATAAIHQRLKRGSNGEVLLTEALIEVFETLMLEGNTRTNAARVVGLSRKTMQEWCRKGAADVGSGKSSLEGAFVWMVDRSEGDQERTLARAAFGMATREGSDGTLALKILERRNADDWAPALPDASDPAAQYAGMQKAALKEEARRILKAAVVEETVVEAEDKKG